MTDKRHDHADDYGGPESLEDLRRRRAEVSRRRMRDRGVKTFAERSAEDQRKFRHQSFGFGDD